MIRRPGRQSTGAHPASAAHILHRRPSPSAMSAARDMETAGHQDRMRIRFGRKADAVMAEVLQGMPRAVLLMQPIGRDAVGLEIGSPDLGLRRQPGLRSAAEQEYVGLRERRQQPVRAIQPLAIKRGRASIRHQPVAEYQDRVQATRLSHRAPSGLPGR